MSERAMRSILRLQSLSSKQAPSPDPLIWRCEWMPSGERGSMPSAAGETLTRYSATAWTWAPPPHYRRT